MIEIESIFYILVAVGVMNVILIGSVLYLEIKVKKILLGKDARSLEDTITNLDNEIRGIQGFRKELESYLRTVETRLRKSVQGVETVRFNPFKGDGSGGNQSFATGFVNENGDGVVISSLYSRERVSVFSKPVKNLKSEYELTKEEKESLQKAKDSIGKKII